jgi:hypothetical protein
MARPNGHGLKEGCSQMPLERVSYPFHVTSADEHSAPPRPFDGLDPVCLTFRTLDLGLPYQQLQQTEPGSDRYPDRTL